MQKLAVKQEAARRTLQGLRHGKHQLLPQAFRESMTKDPQVMLQFQHFLDDVGVVCSKKMDPVEQEAAPTPAAATKKRKSDEDHNSEQEVIL